MAREAGPFTPCRDPYFLQQHLLNALPAWSGWCHTASLSALLGEPTDDRRPTHDFASPNREWVRQYPVYRFVVTDSAPRPADRRTTLYVGLTYSNSGSVQKRVRAHMKPNTRDAGSLALQSRVDAVGRRHVDVEMGTVQTLYPRLAHAVEILLQRAENVAEWNRIQRTMTFDEFESAVADTLVDLRWHA